MNTPDPSLLEQAHLLEALLVNTKVGEIKKHESSKRLVILSKDDTVQNAMETLASNEITAAPVLDETSNKILGFVDTLDLAMFIIRVFAENYEKHPHLYDPKEIKQRFDLPVSEVINASSRDPFLPVDASESLMNLINGFLRFGVHRVPVKSGHTITSILSQSDVVRYIGKYPKQMEFLRHKRLHEVGLDKGPVISITNDQPLMKAFTTILHHKISGLCVTDMTTGEIINNLSASDLKGVTQGSFYKLEAPIHQVLLYNPKLAPVVISTNSSVGEVIDHFLATGVHRMYVLDKDRRPVNVITLTNILGLLADISKRT